MHLYAILALVAAQAGPPGGAGGGGNATSSCVDYQRCAVQGTVELVGGGRHAAATLTLVDGSCMPLLVSSSQARRLRRTDGRAVRLTGAALPRMPDPRDDMTLELAYFDRWLPVGICRSARNALYVERVSP